MTQQRILLTGTSSGFGHDAALQLARRGHRVVASMRNTQTSNRAAAETLRGLASAEALTLEVLDLDVSSAAAIGRAVEAVLAGGPLDVVVHNAGFGLFGWTEGFHDEQVRRLFDVNFFGPVTLNRAVLPAFRARGSGLLVHVTSVLAHLPVRFMSAYNATKAALESYAESLHLELAPLGLQSLIVQPGFFATEFGRNMLPPADQARLTTYGAEALTPQRTLEGFGEMLRHMPPVSNVTETLVGLIEAAPSARPLRTVVSAPPHGELVAGLNAAQAEATRIVQRIMTGG